MFHVAMNFSLSHTVFEPPCCYDDGIRSSKCRPTNREVGDGRDAGAREKTDEDRICSGGDVRHQRTVGSGVAGESQRDKDSPAAAQRCTVSSNIMPGRHVYCQLCREEAQSLRGKLRHHKTETGREIEVRDIMLSSFYMPGAI